MKSNLIKVLKYTFVILFWLLVWHAAAEAVGNNYFLPSVKSTFESLIEILKSRQSYLWIMMTFFRVVYSFILGSILGLGLGIICNHCSFIFTLLSPIFTIIKSTPVACFITILWVSFSGDAVSIIIGVIMVMPIIWQNVMDGYKSIDPQLKEITYVYKFNKFKKFKFLTLPSLKKFLVPAIITSCGLCWKAEIAAEIMAYTTKSIGQSISDAKYDSNSPAVFAWSIIIIVLSVVLEFFTRKLLRRYASNA